MKIAIVSDSHDNIPNIDKMLGYTKNEKINIMLHCGDVCAPSVLEYLAKKFTGEIYHVYGNVDGDREMMEKISKKYSSVHLLGDEGTVKIKGINLKIGIVHYPGKAREMAASANYDIAFYGHNHRPWDEVVRKTRLINPGTLAGLFQKATFAIWDTESGKLELKVLEII